MKKGTIIKTIVIFCAFALIIGVCYYKISNGKRRVQEEQDVTSTAVKNVLLRDLSKNYPPSPREVVKFYNEITKCFYNEEYSDDELEQLAHKALELYDEQLIDEKIISEEKYLNDLNADIQVWREAKRTISSYSMSSTTDVENSKSIKEDGRECAEVYCYYSVRSGTKTVMLSYVYHLRKDSNNYWKILGWKPVE